MKILIVADTYPPNVNGAALATERLAQELVKKGHNVSVIAPSPAFTTSKKTQDNLTIYRVRSIPVLLEKIQEFRISPTPLHAKEIRNIVRQVQPDIIHIIEPWFLGLSAITVAKENNIPLVATHHFMPENIVHYLHLPSQIETMLTRAIWKWYANFCLNLAIVICPTQTAADLLMKYNRNVKIRVISNGIDLEKFSPQNNGDYLKERFNLPPKPILLYVGRLDKEKNLDVLIRAASKIYDKVDFHILIVGQGKEKNALKELSRMLGIGGKVTLTGYLPKKDLPNIYTVGDIFIIPSIAELQSLVTMEAMATGLPIIGANAVALPNLIHDGKNGFLFTPGNSNDLAQKLFRLLQDRKLQKDMGKESLEMIKEHAVDKTIKKVEDTYEEAIQCYKVSKKRKGGKVKQTDVISKLKKIAFKKVIPNK